MTEENQPVASAFSFHGQWQDFAKIAIPNLLLTIVTLGVYRFWATTRERQYLWGKSRFIGEPLEWTGRGIELFLGAVMAIVLIFLPFFLINMLTQALILRGYGGFAALLTFMMFGGIMYLVGVARFRALRYRMSRTYWHGIRGGSNDPGLRYGWSYIWKTIAGYIVFGLLVPWSMMALWNERWNKMSFGPHKIDAVGDYGQTFRRYLLFYLSPIILFVAALVMVPVVALFSDNPATAAFGVFLGIFVFYGLLGVIAMAFYAKFFRIAVGGLSMHKLDFAFAARTKQWLVLFLGDAGLWVIAAIPFAAILGISGLLVGLSEAPTAENIPAYQQAMVAAIIGLGVLPFALVGPFIRYRHWKFFITHMEAYGEINLDELTQSETAAPRQGEGLLDALDVGAI